MGDQAKKLSDISIRVPRNVKQSITYKQLGILVLDGSGSMSEECLGNLTKGEAVSKAVSNMFSRFKESSIKRNFCFSVVYYDNTSKVRMGVTEVDDIDDHASYNPLDEMGGATFISEGLKSAYKIAKDFLSQQKPGGPKHSVVIVIMSDGVDMKQDETKRVAEDLKKIPSMTITSCFFETLGALEEDMHECANYMKSLASKEDLFISAATTEQLRSFFVASMAAAAPGKKMI